jgi:hypothetical protein
MSSDLFDDAPAHQPGPDVRLADRCALNRVVVIGLISQSANTDRAGPCIGRDLVTVVPSGSTAS